MGCLTPGYAPCVTWSLENAPEQRNFNPMCNAGYAPYFGRMDGDSMTRFSGNVYLSAGESRLKETHVAFRVYRPLAHFTRQVVIPNIRLSDWKPE